MDEKVVVVNTHPGHNPVFVDGLVKRLRDLGVNPRVIAGHEGENPLEEDADRILLTGVPLEANYSLCEAETQKVIERCFSWLKQCESPLLGICYGHHILAHVFGGEVSTLREPVRAEEYFLKIRAEGANGIFGRTTEMTVFVEHKDYVSKLPEDFLVLAEKDQVPYVICYPEKQMYGVQLVPELSGEAGQEILGRFVSG